ncbi:membrane hypothetical protein [Candidatus Nitrospira nitrosa]|uniref:DUF805 domain-containing protein n=1 Tax=Candidatus Nitrospira nitrosa TaxID=1742972 RepID=A0A0S4LD60_9BACT|nr:DUF805 domain-containing protein [Candidatus Nitrospira nitrosa]CUS33828.1 membrane hypothetical protein [Candidatus Nitrospira nitrosa]
MNHAETNTEVVDVNTADRVSRSLSELAKQLGWLLFSFKGRLARAPYFLSTFLLYGIILFTYFVIPSFIDSGLITISEPFSSGESSGGWSDSAKVVGFILGAVVVVWANFAITFKRFHDFGESLGTFIIFCLVGLIPYVGGFVWLYPLIRSSDLHPNEYGQGPGWNNWSKPQVADAVRSDTATVSYKDLI